MYTLCCQGRTASQQRDSVIAGFPKIPSWFRRLFPYSRWGAEANATLTLSFFGWLVGPMTVEEIEVDGVPQRSGVLIKRCRYLAESNCAGMCNNLCRFPVTKFFTEELGMPMSMEPGFETYACKMKFGVAPPPLEDDPVTRAQPCLGSCSAAMAGARCHKLT
jgi:hypothetical protein